MAAMKPVVYIYPLSNYEFKKKAAKLEKDASVDDRLARMRQTYMREGMMRTSVHGILVVHERNCPHVITFRIGDTLYELPGGRLEPGEDEIEGLRRKLTSKLGVPGSNPNWQIGKEVGVWWRPNFEKEMYPYCPPHITKPKECKKLYIVHLSEKQQFAVPNNLKFLAVPLFEIYNNDQVHEDNHPHILLLRQGDTIYKLPGGRLKPDEDEFEGLKRKLTSKLAGNSPASHPDWQIGECVDQWWRPNFDDVMYPYGPPFITEPKECKTRYIVHLPERECFAVRNNFKIHAVPLYELFNNDQKYGRVLASLPQHLSRFQLKLISP